MEVSINGGIPLMEHPIKIIMNRPGFRAHGAEQEPQVTNTCLPRVPDSTQGQSHHILKSMLLAWPPIPCYDSHLGLSSLGKNTCWKPPADHRPVFSLSRIPWVLDTLNIFMAYDLPVSPRFFQQLGHASTNNLVVCSSILVQRKICRTFITPLDLLLPYLTTNHTDFGNSELCFWMFLVDYR